MKNFTSYKISIFARIPHHIIIYRKFFFVREEGRLFRNCACAVGGVVVISCCDKDRF